ncbi:hypothetical protein J6590_058284 [Homalodisca vitripennis]|nr:hypothetical protein J6590_058284 [Homalodisca vitripennis]
MPLKLNQTVWDVLSPSLQEAVKVYGLKSGFLSLTVELVTVGHFTLPITSLLINVESQPRRTTNLLHTGFCAPGEQKGNNSLIIEVMNNARRVTSGMGVVLACLQPTVAFVIQPLLRALTVLHEREGIVAWRCFCKKVTSERSRKVFEYLLPGGR